MKIFSLSADELDKNMSRLAETALELKNKFQSGNVEITVTTSKNKNIAESVLVKARQTQADLIVISPGIDVEDKPFFIGPFSQRIINHAKVPILSILRTSAEMFSEKILH